MADAQIGDAVKVHYKGTLTDGTVFDDSRQRGPLEFTIGEGELIPGFEEAVTGMSPGETRSADVPAEKAYGEHREEMVASIDRSELPEDMEIEVGQRLEIQQQDGPPLVVTVTEVDESSVILDGNHPLAGEDLSFEIELLEIE